MKHVFLSVAAEKDIISILAWSEEQFGEQARIRYETLIAYAINNLSVDNYVYGSCERSEIAAGIRTYHLRYCRDSVSRKVGRVKSPRHFIIYRINQAGNVEIGRVLHESMDIDNLTRGISEE